MSDKEFMDLVAQAIKQLEAEKAAAAQPTITKSLVKLGKVYGHMAKIETKKVKESIRRRLERLAKRMEEKAEALSQTKTEVVYHPELEALRAKLIAELNTDGTRKFTDEEVDKYVTKVFFS